MGLSMRPIASIVLLVGLSLPAPAGVARGVVVVGDKPTLEFQAADGSQVSLERLKGKIVIVDFWATWCGPCMAEAGHMVELNEKHAAEGVQLIGISLDEDKSAMVATAKEKGFTWPQVL